MDKPICEAAYISALLEIPDLGLESCRRILERFPSPHEAWHTLILDGQLSVLENINPKLIANLSRNQLRGLPETIQASMDDCSIKGLTYLDDAYPQQLLSIYKPPLVLFYRGDISLASQARMIGMVGARKSSMYGRNVAHYLGKTLAQAGVVIVSGGARGIDSFSHEGALEGEGKTIVVLGSGLDVIYPRENGRLFRQVVEAGGLLLSEYPPHTPPSAHHFPMRNRIIEGLVRGVIVVEAKASSGSLITADMAINDGRDVFSVPGNILDNQAAGNHWLIRQGAMPLTGPQDLLDYYAWTGEVNSGRQSSPMVCFSSEENAILTCLPTDRPCPLDDILVATGLPMPQVMTALLSLEMHDRVEKISGQGYLRKWPS